jgi:hypothetical protein
VIFGAREMCIKYMYLIVCLFACLFVLLCSVCGYLYNMWFIEISLRKCLHGWRIRREIFFFNMGGNVICRLDRLPHSWAFSHLLRCRLDFLIPFGV